MAFTFIQNCVPVSVSKWTLVTMTFSQVILYNISYDMFISYCFTLFLQFFCVFFFFHSIIYFPLHTQEQKHRGISMTSRQFTICISCSIWVLIFFWYIFSPFVLLFPKTNEKAALRQWFYDSDVISHNSKYKSRWAIYFVICRFKFCN